jgi:hypothetical protein
VRGHRRPRVRTHLLDRLPARATTVGEETVGGHQAIVLTRTEDWLQQALLVDKDTLAYLGQRGVVVKDATLSPEKAGNATGEIKRGHVAMSIRLATALVDDAGLRG